MPSGSNYRIPIVLVVISTLLFGGIFCMLSTETMAMGHEMGATQSLGDHVSYMAGLAQGSASQTLYTILIGAFIFLALLVFAVVSENAFRYVSTSTRDRDKPRSLKKITAWFSALTRSPGLSFGA